MQITMIVLAIMGVVIVFAARLAEIGSIAVAAQSVLGVAILSIVAGMFMRSLL